MLPARRTTLEHMPRGDFGIKRTLDAMEKLTREGVRSPLVIQTARSLIAHLPEKDHKREAQTLFDYVKDRVRYVRDPIGVEFLRDPERILQEIRAEGRATGDCDELSVLVSSLLRAVGIPTRYKVVSLKGPTPSLIRDSQFSHVYLEALLDNKWISLDPTAKSQGMGWEVNPRGGAALYNPFGYHFKQHIRRRQKMSYGNSGYENGLGQVIPEGTEATAPASPLDWFSKLAETTIPLLERYGVLKPREYAPTGERIYVRPLPVAPTYAAAAIQQFERPVVTPLGTLTQGQIMMIGAGALALFLLMPRGGRRRR